MVVEMVKMELVVMVEVYVDLPWPCGKIRRRNDGRRECAVPGHSHSRC